MSKIIEHNIETGEVIERDMTKDELAQLETDKTDRQAKEDAIAAKAISKAALLERLGITAEEAVLLLS